MEKRPPMTKEQLQASVRSIEEQAQRTVNQIDNADCATIERLRGFDPHLVSLLERGTAQRRAISVEILDYLKSRREAAHQNPVTDGYVP